MLIIVIYHLIYILRLKIYNQVMVDELSKFQTLIQKKIKIHILSQKIIHIII